MQVNVSNANVRILHGKKMERALRIKDARAPTVVQVIFRAFATFSLYTKLKMIIVCKIYFVYVSTYEANVERGAKCIASKYKHSSIY